MYEFCKNYFHFHVFFYIMIKINIKIREIGGFIIVSLSYKIEEKEGLTLKK